VVSSELCTAGGKKAAGFVRHVSISVAGTPLAGAFRAGQSFGVLAPGEDHRGKAHKPRLYSIASPTRGEDGQGAVLATTVKRLIDEHTENHGLFLGVASNYLCDLQEGDEVRVSGPAGKRFLLPADVHAHDYVFVATGTGIAPFRGMIGDLVAAGYAGRATLLMGAPYATDLLYHHEMNAIAEQHGWFRYLPALSRERQDDIDRPLYVQDRIIHDPVGPDGVRLQLASDRTLVYICGIAGMELGVLKSLHGLGEAGVQYVAVDDDIAGNPAGWTRRMIHRQVRPTKRVLMEVY
jgi:ferredoxin--NADP+ reductase